MTLAIALPPIVIPSGAQQLVSFVQRRCRFTAIVFQNEFTDALGAEHSFLNEPSGHRAELSFLNECCRQTADGRPDCRHLQELRDAVPCSPTGRALTSPSRRMRPSRAVEPPEHSRIVALPQVGGLHHRYVRRAALVA